MALLKYNGQSLSAVRFNGTPLTKVYYNGTLVFSAQTNYFTNGTQNVPWTTGYSTGNAGDAYIDSASMYLTAGYSGTQVNERSLRTTNTVSLTGVNTLYCEVAFNSTGNAQSFSFIASTSSTGTSSTFNARTQLTGGFGDTQIISLDVSGLSGNYFIRVHSRDGSTASFNGNDATVYRIWGV